MRKKYGLLSIVVLIILLLLFALRFMGFMDMSNPPLFAFTSIASLIGILGAWNRLSPKQAAIIIVAFSAFLIFVFLWTFNIIPRVFNPIILLVFLSLVLIATVSILAFKIIKNLLIYCKKR